MLSRVASVRVFSLAVMAFGSNHRIIVFLFLSLQGCLRADKPFLVIRKFTKKEKKKKRSPNKPTVVQVAHLDPVVISNGDCFLKVDFVLLICLDLVVFPDFEF